MPQSIGCLAKTISSRSKRMDGPFGRRYYTIVYAIASPDDGPIKFGRTLNVERRFSSISTMSPVPLTLLGHVWLPDDAEAYIHEFLKEDRSHGEWFRRTERSRGLAALVAAKKAVDIADVIGLTWMVPESVPSGVAWGRV
jgi:hypothetical protein